MRLFWRKITSDVKVGDVWRRTLNEGNPFEITEFVDRTVLEVVDGWAKCSLKYSDGLEPKRFTAIPVSTLKEFSKLLNP